MKREPDYFEIANRITEWHSPPNMDELQEGKKYLVFANGNIRQATVWRGLWKDWYTQIRIYNVWMYSETFADEIQRAKVSKYEDL